MNKNYSLIVLIALIGIVGFVFAEIPIIMSGAITITGFSGDQVCAGTELDPCYAYINFTANEDIFIYPVGYDPWGRNTLFEFSPGVKDWKLQRSWGKGWRDIPLNLTCAGTWCGAPNNLGVAYSWVLREDRDYKVRIVALKNSPYDTIKWAVNYEDKEYLDPTWESPFEIAETTEEKLIDTDYQTYLRESDSLRLRKDDYYKSYDASEKRLLIENSKFETKLEIELVSDYKVHVGAGEDVKVAEFLLVDWNGDDLFDLITSYDVKKGYEKNDREYWLKYGTDYVFEECFDLPVDEVSYSKSVPLKYCENVTRTNWTRFEYLSELPNKNISVGLFTDTVFGENVEWVPTIEGFEILELAEWDVTAGTKFEFDTVYGRHNSLVKINDTHYLNTYMGDGYTGFAVVLKVDGETITKGTAFEFDTVKGQYNSLVKINDTHYLNTYMGDGYDGFAVVLKVDGETITKGTAFEFDTVTGQHNSLVKINDTHYLNTYTGDGSDGFAVVLKVDGETITKGTAFEFDTVQGQYNSLVKINDTHYLNTYMGDGSDGFAVVLKVELPSPPVDNPPTYSLNQTNNTIAGASTLFSILYDDDTALHPNGQYIFSTNNTGTWTNDSAVNFTATPNWANVTKTLNSTSGISIGYRWYADDNAGNINNTGIFTLTTTSSDTCTYTSGNWEIDCNDNCSITENVDLGGNNISINGTGTLEIFANITNWNEILFNPVGCQINTNSGGGLQK